MAVPGLVRVWDGTRAVVEAYPIPSRFVIGRDRFAYDEKMSAQHAEIVVSAGAVAVHDLRSRNGTYVDGTRLQPGASVELEAVPAVVCCGRSVFVVMSDIRAYGGAQLERKDGVDVGASLSVAWRTIEEAARAEDSVLIAGPTGSPKRALADAYAALRGRGSVMYSAIATTRPLDDVLVPPIGTVVIEHASSLTSRDFAALEPWLETDVRFVTLGLPGIEKRVPAALRDRLFGRMIELPPLRARPEELACAVRRHADAALEVHYTAIDACLRRSWPYDAEQLAVAVEEACREARERQGSKLRAGDFRAEVAPPTVDFRATFERVFGTPPPFVVPDERVPVIVREGQEKMFVSSVRERPILVQSQIGEIETKPIGWFQAGFWGHGVNSDAFYFGEVTDRHRVLFRVPYGGGVYRGDAGGERARVLELLELYLAFRARSDVRSAMLVEAMGRARYEVEYADGRVVRADDAYTLDAVIR